MRIPVWLSHHIAALRALLVFTVLTGLLYPLLVLGVAQMPGLRGNANGSEVSANGKVVGSRIIGQSFTDADGNALPQYFQSRPSAAGDGYDPTSTAASNLGPEDVLDTFDDPATTGEGADESSQSLLTQVCSRSKAVGELEGVDGRRPYCTAGGVGAVLGVYYSEGTTGTVTRVVSLNENEGSPFVSTFQGVPVELAKVGEDYSRAVITPIRGNAPADPAVPADAVTASASGLDPHISPAYARLQAARVATQRGITPTQVRDLINKYTDGRALGFMGDPGVNVLELNLELDATYPTK